MAGSVFAKHYDFILEHTKKTGFDAALTRELLHIMYVLCDLAVRMSGRARSVAKKAYNSQHDIVVNDRFDAAAFDLRCELYQDVLDGKRVRGEWCSAKVMAALPEQPPIVHCIALLGDILYNPFCVTDYYGTPIVPFEDRSPLVQKHQLAFTREVMKPLFRELRAYYDDLYRHKA